MNTLLRAAAIAALIAAPAAHAADAAFATTTLALSARGEASAVPDMATITLGVETNAGSAGQAMRDNAARMNQVIATVKAAGVADRDLRTANLDLSPQYAYAAGQAPRLTGYRASDQLTVTVADLARLGPIADAVVSAGATSVGGITFGLAHPLSSENAARLAAVKALEDKAALYAQSAGYHIVRLVSLSEGAGCQAPPIRPMAAFAMQAPAAPTPVEAGETKVRIDVNGVFELGR
jgi:uncharacterized protein YggE